MKVFGLRSWLILILLLNTLVFTYCYFVGDSGYAFLIVINLIAILVFFNLIIVKNGNINMIGLIPCIFKKYPKTLNEIDHIHVATTSGARLSLCVITFYCKNGKNIPLILPPYPFEIKRIVHHFESSGIKVLTD